MSLSAQTEFDIRANTPDIKSEFQQEMDTLMLKAYEGDREAQFKIGVLFTNKQFDEPDYEQAVYWYKQAARQGHILAQYNLGHQYLVGLGVQRDEAQAMQWWLKAADQDHPLAAFNIGRAYYLGIGLEEDHSQSRSWFERAARNGEPKSIEILEQLGWAEPGQYAKSSQGVASVDTANATETETSTPDLSESNTSTPQVITLPEVASDLNVSDLEATDQNRPMDNDLPTATIETPEVADSALSNASASDPEETDAGQGIDVDSSNEIETIASDIAVSQEQANQDDIEQIETTDVTLDTESETEQRATVPSRFENPIESSIEEPEASASDASTVATTDITPTTSTTTATPNTTAASPAPLAVYTDPKIRSVLIAILDDRSGLNIEQQDDSWAVVSNESGFPVWVHGDFILVSDSLGVISGSNVNARSVPIVTSGTVVGRLQKEEMVQVLEQRDEWYRIQSPSRFQAWVKTDELNAAPIVSASVETNVDRNKEWQITAKSQPINQPSSADDTDYENDNDWLFKQPAQHYTLQLASFDEQSKIDEFMSRKKFENNHNLRRFTSNSSGVEWTYFLYGSFETTDLAKQTREAIDQRLAWVRSFGRLQQNRCLAWKKQIPPPNTLNKYCLQ